jgi:hypothetical protein
MRQVSWRKYTMTDTSRGLFDTILKFQTLHLPRRSASGRCGRWYSGRE